MNHYFYAPVPADLAENWKSPFPADTVKVYHMKQPLHWQALTRYPADAKRGDQDV